MNALSWRLVGFAGEAHRAEAATSR